MKARNVITIFSALIFTTSAYGQGSSPLTHKLESLSLESAVQIAKENSPDLKKAELAADSASWGKLEAVSEHLPHLTARGTHYLGAEYARLNVKFGPSTASFPSAFPQTSAALEASLLIFDGMGAINRVRAALLNHDAAELEWNRAKFKIEELVQVRYFQALAAQENAKVAEQNIETLENHLKLVTASVRAGISSKVDILRLETLLEEAKAEKMVADDNISITRSALNEVMGIEDDSRPLEGTLPIPDPKKVHPNLAVDVSKRDDIIALTKRDLADTRLSNAALSPFFPRVSIFWTKEYYKYGDFDPAVVANDTFQSAYSYGIKASWNLFEGGASIAKKARASDAAQMKEEETRKTLNSAPREFEIWKRRYVSNAAVYSARKRSIEKSEESVRLATISVKAGTKTHAEALDAELDLFRARAGLIRSQLDAAEALAHLEFALGYKL
ncbi:MAG: TolC family protein [Bacteriovoracia bacterium]